MNARLFWPLSQTHRVAQMELRSDSVKRPVEPLLADMQTLASLADTIRSLEGPDGHPAWSNAVRAAAEQSAAILERTAQRLPGPESEVIAMRAAGLNGGDHAAAARRQAELDERDLVLLCGPMSTWRRKSQRQFHGMMASVPLVRWNTLVADADAMIDDLVAYVAETVAQPRLTVVPVPGFRVGDLLYCGGEPDGFPKHFAYFLPEDEGIRGARLAKTIVYANVYAAHHEQISKRLAERVFLSPGLWPEQPLEILLLWFRGHDVGHQLRLPQTSYRALHVVGLETSIALQEALADVIGYLALTGGPWQVKFDIDRAAAGSVFLAEMLRYVQRGPGLFPDSDAAFLELSFLHDRGYVRLDAATGRLDWEPDRLHDGVIAIARELTSALLDTDVAQTAALIEAHMPGEHEPLAGWRASFDVLISDIPTTFAYRATVHPANGS